MTTDQLLDETRRLREMLVDAQNEREDRDTCRLLVKAYNHVSSAEDLIGQVREIDHQNKGD